MKKTQARLVASAATGVLALSAGGASAAATQSVIYTMQDPSQWGTWLIDWNTTMHTAHVTDNIGASDGTFTNDGTQRVITLATPISHAVTQVDCTYENEFPQRVDVTQIVLRPTTGTSKRGTSQVVEIGTTTDLGGCTPGLVTPFGSPTDPGVATNHLDMNARPATDDLAPGAQLAGMSETPASADSNPTRLVAQVATFGTGTLTFADSGHVVPASTSNGWIVADFGSFQRGYTRLSVDAKTGAELWAFAPWSAGGPAIVQSTMMVKPNAAAGFGRNAAAHDWESGLYDSGDFVHGINWAFQDANILIQRPDNVWRTWRPIATNGKNHFVLENEIGFDAACGCAFDRFVSRVNYYIDEGKSTPPTETNGQSHTPSSEVHSRPPHHNGPAH